MNAEKMREAMIRASCLLGDAPDISFTKPVDRDDMADVIHANIKAYNVLKNALKEIGQEELVSKQ